MSMQSPQNNPHYMIAGPPMSFGMMKGGMNAPPPHHNQYPYHPQYQGGHAQGFGGGAWGQSPQSPQPMARFAAENARRAAAGTAAGGPTPGKDDKTSPFLNTAHSHPGFQPQKIGKGPSGGANLPKPPKAPEKPLMPYMRYSRRVWDSVKSAHPDLKLWEIGRIIGGMWRDLPENEKSVFVDEYEAEKAVYTEMLKTYQTSPAYVQWCAYRARAVGNLEDESSSKKGAKDQQDRRIDIQPAEDEEDQDDSLSVKHIAYARYLRNHRLINEIFSDTVVPDVRSVVTTARMHILKKQVQSLTMHQKKLEDELQQIEEKFDAKKRKFVESSEAFQEELKKHCKPAVDEETFQRMVTRATDQLRRGLNPQHPLYLPSTKEEPMEQDASQPKEASGPNPPTQIDKVSPGNVAKPSNGNVATEIKQEQANEGGDNKETKEPPQTLQPPPPQSEAHPLTSQPQPLQTQPQNIPGQPQNIPGQPQIIPGHPQNIPGQPQIIPGHPQNVPNQPQPIHNQPQPMQSQPHPPQHMPPHSHMPQNMPPQHIPSHLPPQHMPAPAPMGEQQQQSQGHDPNVGPGNQSPRPEDPSIAADPNRPPPGTLPHPHAHAPHPMMMPPGPGQHAPHPGPPPPGGYPGYGPGGGRYYGAGYGPGPGAGYPQPYGYYPPPPSGHGAPPSGHGAPPSGHGAPPSGHGAPPSGHGAPPSVSPAPHHAMPEHKPAEELQPKKEDE